MHAEIVSIGTELLMGEIVDTNSAYLASELPKLGIELRWGSKVSDTPAHMTEVLHRAWNRSNVTLMTGGLGPTSDDLTRETIAGILGEKMQVQDDLLQHLKAQFASYGIPMPENNIKQATLIPSASVIPNPIGTAPGWWVERDSRIIIAMPSPPRELHRMWTNEVAPRLKQRNPNIAIATRTWKTFGISEGGLNEMLAPLFETENPKMGIYSRADGIHLRALASTPTEPESRKLLDAVETQIRDIAGDAIWGIDDHTPNSLLAEKLTTRKLSLATMECHTAGLLASTLADKPTSPNWFMGGIVIPTGQQLQKYDFGAITTPQGVATASMAEAMARTARQQLGASVGIGITAIASDEQGDDPVQVCFIGYDINGKVVTTELRYPNRLMMLKERMVVQALLGLLKLLG